MFKALMAIFFTITATQAIGGKYPDPIAGEQAYNMQCASCHGAKGMGINGKMQLNNIVGKPLYGNIPQPMRDYGSYRAFPAAPLVEWMDLVRYMANENNVVLFKYDRGQSPHFRLDLGLSGPTAHIAAYIFLLNGRQAH